MIIRINELKICAHDGESEIFNCSHGQSDLVGCYNRMFMAVKFKSISFLSIIYEPIHGFSSVLTFLLHGRRMHEEIGIKVDSNKNCSIFHAAKHMRAFNYSFLFHSETICFYYTSPKNRFLQHKIRIQCLCDVFLFHVFPFLHEERTMMMVFSL